MVSVCCGPPPFCPREGRSGYLHSLKNLHATSKATLSRMSSCHHHQDSLASSNRTLCPAGRQCNDHKVILSQKKLHKLLHPRTNNWNELQAPCKNTNDTWRAQHKTQNMREARVVARKERRNTTNSRVLGVSWHQMSRN